MVDRPPGCSQRTCFGLETKGSNTVRLPVKFVAAARISWPDPCLKAFYGIDAVSGLAFSGSSISDVFLAHGDTRA